MGDGGSEGLDLSSPMWEGHAPDAPAARAVPEVGQPSRIGRYRIIRELGRGGMGVVFEAEEPFPARRVALKLVGSASASDELSRRFAHEARALAMLQHPGIAQLFEAGTADVERGAGGHAVAYIAMELAIGRPITTYAREEALGVAEKLELIVRVCEAVDHAHRRGVIHRDLKPANIVVLPGGVVKVLDFGVARLIDAEADVTQMTTPGQFVGTIGYMSPEQLAGQAGQIDTRADVYALGVMMHEVLGGEPAFALKGLSVIQAIEAMRTREPQALGKIDPSMKGDLESIVAKAMERDAGRRYASASELASDIRRMRAHEPVSARPLTTLYQLGKFARRHKGTVLATTMIVVAIVLGVIATGWQAVAASRERDRATEQAQRAIQTRGLLERMLRLATPHETGGQTLTIREMLDRAAGDLDESDGLLALVEADTRVVLATVYGNLGEYAESERQRRRAIELYTRERGAESPEVLNELAPLSLAIAEQDRGAEAEAIARRGLEIAERTVGRLDGASIDLCHAIAHALAASSSPDHEEILRWEREAFDRASARFGPDHPETLMQAMNLAITQQELGQLEAAGPTLIHVRDVRLRELGADDPETMIAENNVLSYYSRVGREAEALAGVSELAARASRVLGPTHPSTLVYLRNRAMLLAMSGRMEEASEAARSLYEGRLERLGATHRDTCEAQGLLATLLVVTGKPDEAEAIAGPLYQMALATFGPDDHATHQAMGLFWDIAEARNDPVAMRRWADALRGTAFETEVERQMTEKGLGREPSPASAEP
jgi:tetratricopeptide (TPR) repeat protein